MFISVVTFSNKREMDDLYLDVVYAENDDFYRMSLYSAITLFILKFCQIDQQFTLNFVTVRIFRLADVIAQFAITKIAIK